MAKKSSTNGKAATKSELVVPESLVEVSVQLDKDDVAAILMARAEEYLKKQIQACQKKADELSKKNAELLQARQAAFKKRAEEQLSGTADALRTAAQALKCKRVNLDIDVESHSLDAGNISAALKLSASQPSFESRVVTTISMTKTERDACKALSDCNAAQRANQQEWYELRRKLADLPALERRAKAAVAEQRLKSTAEGRELVNTLTAQLDGGLALLGIS